MVQSLKSQISKMAGCKDIDKIQVRVKEIATVSDFSNLYIFTNKVENLRYS